MGGSGDCHIKWNKTEKHQYHMILLMWCCLYRVLKTTKMNLLTKPKQTLRLGEWIYSFQGVGKHEGRDRPGVWDWHVHTTILKQITNKDLLYSTGNSSVLCNNLNGKRIWNDICTCICINESLCCVLETNTTLLINSNVRQKIFN